MARAGPGRGKKKLSVLTSFSAQLQKLGLTKPVALEAQRIGTLPEKELEKALEKAKTVKPPKLTHFVELIGLARPYWYQASRKRSAARPQIGQRSTGKARPQRNSSRGK